VKRIALLLIIAFIMASCDIKDMEDTEEDSFESGEIFKIEYYSVRAKSLVSYSSIELIKSDECQNGKDYIIANYNDMTDEWDKPSALPSFAGWYTVNPYLGDESVYDGVFYEAGSAIKITENNLYIRYGDSVLLDRVNNYANRNKVAYHKGSSSRLSELLSLQANV
jgi:hypothetical protein